MDLSGLTSVTTNPEMITWLKANLITPVSPAISGSDLGIIMQKILQVSEDSTADLVLFDTKTGNYTLASTDTAIDMNVAGSNNITVPNDTDVAFPTGKQIIITQSGTGQTNIVAGSGVTINATHGYLSLTSQFSGARLIKRAANTWWLSGDLAQEIVLKTVKINLTDIGDTVNIPEWNNKLFLSTAGSPLSLLTSDGSPSGWSIVATIGTPGTENFEQLNFSFGNADFPDEILDTLWYLDHGINFSFVVSGLNPGKTYTVKTCSADTGDGDGPTKVTVGGVFQIGESPNSRAVELIFESVTSDSEGNLTIIVDNTAGTDYPLLNAIIITEN